VENQAAKAADASDKQPIAPIQEALSIYHVCKDGLVTTNPKDCHTTNLHPMNIEGLAKT
jgi:hypothetical protein